MRWHSLALLSAQFIPDLIDETTFEASGFLVPVGPLSGKEKSQCSMRRRFFSCLVAGPAVRLYFKNKLLSDYRVDMPGSYGVPVIDVGQKLPCQWGPPHLSAQA